MRSSRSALGLLGALGVLGACGGEELPAQCEGSALTYATFGEPFFTSWCRGCHSRDLPEGLRQLAPLEVNFNTQADVRARAGRVGFLVGEAATMPPAGGPSAGERALLVEWLACGAR
jgi:uncharacterized membrane protein